MVSGVFEGLGGLVPVIVLLVLDTLMITISRRRRATGMADRSGEVRLQASARVVGGRLGVDRSLAEPPSGADVSGAKPRLACPCGQLGELGNREQNKASCRGTFR